MAASGARRLYAQPGPLGIACFAPRAVVTDAEIEPLIAPLDLCEPARLELQSQIRTIMSDYLGPQISGARHADHASSLKQLAHISKGAEQLAALIEALQPDFLVQLDQLRADTTGLHQRSRSHFDFLHLVPQLRDLATVAMRAPEYIKRNDAGRPERTSLKLAIQELAPF